MPQKNSPGFAPVIILTLGFLLGSLITITAVTDNPVKNQVMRALAVSIPNRFEQRDAGLTQYNGAHDYSATEIAAGEKKIAAQEAKRKLSDAKSNGDARTAGGAADAGTAGNTAGTKNTTPLTGGVDGRGTPPGGYTSIQQIVKSGAAVGTVGYDCGGLGKCGYDPTLEVSGFYNAGTPENPQRSPAPHGHFSYRPFKRNEIPFPP